MTKKTVTETFAESIIADHTKNGNLKLIGTCGGDEPCEYWDRGKVGDMEDSYLGYCGCRGNRDKFFDRVSKDFGCIHWKKRGEK